MFIINKRNVRFLANLVFFIFATIFLTFVLGLYLRKELTKNLKTSTEMMFSTVYDAVSEEFDGVLTASRALSTDPFLVESLKDEPRDPEAFRSQISGYLTSLTSYYGWSTMYVVSDATMRYYLPDGSAKVLDPDHDPWDRWYTDMVLSDDEYHVDVDLDKHNTGKWTIFVDTRILNSDGTCAGVCGVGINMQQAMSIARRYTDAYGMEVSFVSADGTARITTSDADVTEAKRDVSTEAKDEPLGEMTEDGYRVSQYLPLIGWYLVVENNQNTVSESLHGMGLIFAAVLAGSLVCVAIINSLLFARERRVLTTKANSDPLTGLLNRAGLEDHICAQLVLDEHASKNGVRPLGCLMMIDLDRFKFINDTFGHDVGDEVLRRVAAVLRSALRDSDIVGRVGGDEFIIYLPSMVSEEIISQKAQQILNGLQEITNHMELDGVETNGSIGIARAPENGTTYEGLYQAADTALYQAKNAGRNQFCIA